MNDAAIIALAERDWWNEIAALFNTKVYSWDGKNSAHFVNGPDIKDSRIANKLHEFAIEAHPRC